MSFDEKMLEPRDLSSSVKIGHIINTRGLRGELKFRPKLTDIPIFPGLFLKIESNNFCVKSYHKLDDMTYILKLDQIESIDDAQILVGKDVYCVRKDLGSVGFDQFLTIDILGLNVFRFEENIIKEVQNLSFSEDILRMSYIGKIDSLLYGKKCFYVNMKNIAHEYKELFDKMEYPLNDFWFPSVFPDLGICFMKILSYEIIK